MGAVSSSLLRVPLETLGIRDSSNDVTTIAVPDTALVTPAAPTHSTTPDPPPTSPLPIFNAGYIITNRNRSFACKNLFLRTFAARLRNTRLLHSCQLNTTFHITVVEPPRYVQKKSSGIRIIVNYRKLNKVTNISQIVIPRVDEVLGTLVGRSVFSAFDLSSGLTQLTLHPDTIPFTAFCTRVDFTNDFACPKEQLAPVPCSFR